MKHPRQWKAVIAVSAGLLLFAGSAAFLSAASLPGGTLDPLSIPKYVDPLPIPGVMQQAGVIIDPATGQQIDYYEIAVRQFQQQVLSTGLPMTTLWSYGTVYPLGTFFYPAFTIEATVNKPVRVKWMNQLVDANGN